MASPDPRAQHRAAAEQIVERIAADAGYRRELLDDPKHALETLLGLEYEPAEVAGYLEAKPKPCKPTCGPMSCRVSCGQTRTCGKVDTCAYTMALQA